MRRLAWVLTVGGCGVAPSPPPSVSHEPSCLAQARLEARRAEGLRAERRLDRALRVLERATALCPAAAPSTRAARAELSLELGLLERATELAGPPGTPQAVEAAARARSARPPGALEPAMAPSAAEVALSRGDAKGASVAFEQTLAKEPFDVRALVGAGVARFAFGDQTGARERLDRALVELERRHGAVQAVVAVATPLAAPGAALVPARLHPGDTAVVLQVGPTLSWLRTSERVGPIERRGKAWVALGEPALVLRDGASKPEVVPGAWGASVVFRTSLLLAGAGRARLLDLADGRTLAEATWSEPKLPKLEAEHVVAPDGAAWKILSLRDLSQVARVESIAAPSVRSGRIVVTTRWSANASVGVVRDLATGRQLFRRVLAETPPDATAQLALAEGSATFAVASRGEVLRIDGPTGKGLVIERWPLGADPPEPLSWLALSDEPRGVCSGADVFGWSRGGAAARPCFRTSGGGAKVIEPPRQGSLWASLDRAPRTERRGAALSPSEKLCALFYRDPGVPVDEPTPSALVLLDAQTGQLRRRFELGPTRFDGWVGFVSDDLAYFRAPGEPVRWFSVSTGEAWTQPERFPLAFELTTRREGVVVAHSSGACFDPLRFLFRPSACREPAPPSVEASGAKERGWTRTTFGTDAPFLVGAHALAALHGGRPLATLVPTSKSSVVALVANGGVDTLGQPTLFCRFGDVLTPFAVCSDRVDAQGLYVKALARAELASAPLTP